MLNIRRVSPLVRAVGTMGAVVALAGGVTFALTNPTNTVSLTSDNITTSGLALTIGPSAGTCTDEPTGASTAGITITGLEPGQTSAATDFCLGNSTSAAFPVFMYLDSTSALTTTNTALLSAVKLNVTCGSATTPVSTALSSIPVSTGPGIIPSSPIQIEAALGTTTPEMCSVTASLPSTYTGTAGSVGTFQIDLFGDQTSA